MAKCCVCGKEMKTAPGCDKLSIVIDGKEYSRILVGRERDFLEGADPSSRCHDCNAAMGYVHHVGCDVERCPKCGGQLVTCGCAAV